MTYIAHIGIGVGGALAAWMGRSFCPHKRHQLIVSGILLVAEGIVSVQVIG